MSTVLEEKIPRIQNYLVEQYGGISESAVDTVSEGIKKAVSLGIASNQEKVKTFEIQNFAYPPLGTNALSPLIGTKISETAGLAPPGDFFQGQFKGMEKAQNAEITAFTKNVFGKSGLLNSLEEKGFVIYGTEKSNQAEKGIVGPEYSPAFRNQLARLQEMKEVLDKTAVLEQDLKKFNWRVRA